MIAVSMEGLDMLTDKQYNFLYYLLSKSFHSNIDEIIMSMFGMKQYFLFRNNKPIAVVSFRKNGSLHCSCKSFSNVLYNIATAPRYRKKGYMKELLQYVLDTLKQEKKKHVYLEVLKDNVKAIGLYKNIGFNVIKECDNILLMRYTLKKQ